VAAPRNQPSKIDRLPAEVQDEIKRLRVRQGWTIDELLAWLREQGHSDISRSGLGNHVRKLHLTVEKAAERIERSQAISTALVERFGDKTDNELARLNINMLHGQVLDMILEEDVAEDEDGNPLPGDSLRLVRLSKTIQQLLSAEKMNAERILQVRKAAIAEERERAAEAVEEVLKSKDRGLSSATIDAIRHAVLGTGGDA
jgi:Protein of unknown function (DUF3486)